MIYRTLFAAPGIEGGRPGTLGEFMADGTKRLQPKTVIWFDPETHVNLNAPGGGGYGNPRQRDPEMVRADVVNGYISLEGAEREYGVAVRYTGEPGALVRSPEKYTIDWAITERLR